MDLGVFQETKVTGGVYTRRSDGYSVDATDAPSRHHGGVVVFYWTSTRYAVDYIHMFRPNAVGFQLETGERRWYII